MDELVHWIERHGDALLAALVGDDPVQKGLVAVIGILLAFPFTPLARYLGHLLKPRSVRYRIVLGLLAWIAAFWIALSIEPPVLICNKRMTLYRLGADCTGWVNLGELGADGKFISGRFVETLSAIHGRTCSGELPSTTCPIPDSKNEFTTGSSLAVARYFVNGGEIRPEHEAIGPGLCPAESNSSCISTKPALLIPGSHIAVLEVWKDGVVGNHEVVWLRIKQLP